VTIPYIFQWKNKSHVPNHQPDINENRVGGTDLNGKCDEEKFAMKCSATRCNVNIFDFTLRVNDG